MIAFLHENIGTILCGSILLIVLILIVRSMVNDKKKGRSSCGCNCSHCAMAGRCHEVKKNR
ncbi:MAG: FeoB-associated Cys-rich membrane protein [Saccharofermentans sp.]|nr:FeoB-associated Cys-rich membrane protein [Saccharofermentans sp.]